MEDMKQAALTELSEAKDAVVEKVEEVVEKVKTRTRQSVKKVKDVVSKKLVAAEDFDAYCAVRSKYRTLTNVTVAQKIEMSGLTKEQFMDAEKNFNKLMTEYPDVIKKYF